MFYKYFVSFWSLQPDLTCIAITTQHTSAKTKVIHDAAILYALTSRVRVFLGNIVHHNNINAKDTYMILCICITLLPMSASVVLFMLVGLISRSRTWEELKSTLKKIAIGSFLPTLTHFPRTFINLTQILEKWQYQNRSMWHSQDNLSRARKADRSIGPHNPFTFYRIQTNFSMLAMSS